MLLAGFEFDGMFDLLTEHDEKESFDEAMTAALGEPAHFVGVDIWGAPGLLVTQRWCHPFDWRVDITALSRSACEPLNVSVMELLSLTPRVFDQHDWPA